jgi:DNA-binding NarL/FixJ family response regulator
MKIKVLISEDQPILGAGLSAQLEAEKDIVLIREPATDESILELVNLHIPDVLIYDFDKDGHFDFETLKKIVKNFGDSVRIVAFTEHGKRSTLFYFFHYGGYGFLTKECDREEILRCIRYAYQKEPFVCSRLAGKIMQNFTKTAPLPPDKERFDKLTSREIDIIRLLGKMESDKEIAAELDLSTETVRWHIKNIKNKLKVKNFLELMMVLHYSDFDL